MMPRFIINMIENRLLQSKIRVFNLQTIYLINVELQDLK